MKSSLQYLTAFQPLHSIILSDNPKHNSQKKREKILKKRNLLVSRKILGLLKSLSLSRIQKIRTEQNFAQLEQEKFNLQFDLFLQKEIIKELQVKIANFSQKSELLTEENQFLIAEKNIVENNLEEIRLKYKIQEEENSRNSELFRKSFDRNFEAILQLENSQNFHEIKSQFADLRNSTVEKISEIQSLNNGFVENEILKVETNLEFLKKELEEFSRCTLFGSQPKENNEHQKFPKNDLNLPDFKNNFSTENIDTQNSKGYLGVLNFQEEENYSEIQFPPTKIDLKDKLEMESVKTNKNKLKNGKLSILKMMRKLDVTVLKRLNQKKNKKLKKFKKNLLNQIEENFQLKLKLFEFKKSGIKA